MSSATERVGLTAQKNLHAQNIKSQSVSFVSINIGKRQKIVKFFEQP